MSEDNGYDADIGDTSDEAVESTEDRENATTELCDNDEAEKAAEADLTKTSPENTDKVSVEEEKETADEADTGTKETEYNDVQKAEIKEKSTYSDEVNDNIKSVDELEHYQKIGLREEQIDGKTCLIRDDIDWMQKDEFGDTNAERVEKGLVPINKNGELVELHHVGQKDDSPLAELTTKEHRGKGNDSVLHDKKKESEIDRPEFTKERKNHWIQRKNLQRSE